MPNEKWTVYKNHETGILFDITDADAQGKLTAILDGTDIDSFSDVESALADKVDAVTGKGLSTNDYDDTEKAKVAGAFPRSEQAVLGARNVAPQYTMASGTVTNGITVTYDENSVVNLNGTASADGYINLRQRNTGTKLPVDGRYKVSGYVNNNCYTFLLASDGTILASSADSVTKGEFDYTSANENFGLIIFVRSGTVLSNQKVYPMITLASDTDTSFSAPAMTNRELTDAIAVKNDNTQITSDNMTIEKCIIAKAGNIRVCTI